MSKDKPLVKRDMRIKLDWKAYFQAFMEVHGEPVVYQRKLLFSDGYRHALNYRGPEIKPPEDAAKRIELKIKYWELRLKIVRPEAEELESEIIALKAVARERSVPLRYVVQELDQNTGKLVQVSKELNIAAQEERLGWLLSDIKHAEMRIEVLKEIGDVDEWDTQSASDEYVFTGVDGPDRSGTNGTHDDEPDELGPEDGSA